MRSFVIYNSDGKILRSGQVDDDTSQIQDAATEFELLVDVPENIEDYVVLALLPSYLERDGSSLIYMTNDLINKSKHPDSGFYLNNLDELALKLTQLDQSNKKVLLIGVSFALLDLIEKHKKMQIQKKLEKNFSNLFTSLSCKRFCMSGDDRHFCDSFSVICV